MKQADTRRRIHVWPTRDRADWSFGPTGARFRATTPGAAVDQALARVGNEPIVIIVEARQ